jgi:F-type Type IV secretion system, TraN
MKNFLIMILFSLNPLFASSQASPQKDAAKLQQQAMNLTKSTSPDIIPGFQTANPAATFLNDLHTLEAGSENIFLTNTYADTLKNAAESRPYFVIDSRQDPLIKNSKEAIQAPEKFLAAPAYKRKTVTEFELKTSQESKPEVELKCSKSLLNPEIHIEPAKYSHYWCSAGNHRPDDPHCGAKQYYSVARMYEAEKIHIVKETWTSTCQALEARTQQRLCKLVKKICPKGPETREVTGTLGADKKPVTRSITRDCWRFEYAYHCSHPSPNTCEALRQSSCEQFNSECLKEVSGVCVEWKQTYRCPKKVQEETVSNQKYTLTEGALPQASPPNQDMSEAISKLSIFREIQDDLRAMQTAEASAIKIFKGEDRQCTLAFGNFKNCCEKGKGWGVSLNLSGCNGEKKDLAERNNKNLCVAIGSFCAEKLAGVCIRKKRAHCCFPTKLSRLIHEQGRKQLGIGWGEPKHPDCRGFTVEELARLNFDQLDLSELYADIAVKVKQTTANTVSRNLSNRVIQMTQEFKNPPQAGEY